MNRDKKRLERQIKANRDLQRKLDDAKIEISKLELDSENSTKRAKELITELEMIKSQWKKSMNELERIQDNYRDLISKTKKIRNAIVLRHSVHID